MSRGEGRGYFLPVLNKVPEFQQHTFVHHGNYVRLYVFILWKVLKDFQFERSQSEVASMQHLSRRRRVRGRQSSAPRSRTSAAACWRTTPRRLSKSPPPRTPPQSTSPRQPPLWPPSAPSPPAQPLYPSPSSLTQTAPKNLNLNLTYGFISCASLACLCSFFTSGLCSTKLTWPTLLKDPGDSWNPIGHQIRGKSSDTSHLCCLGAVMM